MKSHRIELGRYIVADPRICGGQPTFKGTRSFWSPSPGLRPSCRMRRRIPARPSTEIEKLKILQRTSARKKRAGAVELSPTELWPVNMTLVTSGVQARKSGELEMTSFWPGAAAMVRVEVGLARWRRTMLG